MTVGQLTAPTGDPRIAEIKRHMDRYQELVGQGKWSEAGRELEAIRVIVSKCAEDVPAELKARIAIALGIVEADEPVPE